MNRRIPFLLGLAACAGLLGYGYFLQYARGLEPCPLCILQRLAFGWVALVCLAAALHGPRGWAARAYALFALLGAGMGGAVAARQIYLQHLPAGQVPACGPGLEYLVQNFPLRQALTEVLRGSGECAQVAPWSLLGLGIPQWALVWFAVLALLSLWLLVRPVHG